MRTWIVQAVTPILGGLVIFFGVVGLGRAVRVHLGDHLTYSLAFDEIDCQPPEGVSRQQFLLEVRSLAHQPHSLPLLDQKLTARLHGAFAVHPWVESVHAVKMDRSEAKRKSGSARIHVDLVYRLPVLAVRIPAEKTPAPDRTLRESRITVSHYPPQTTRIVDRQGILLPAQWNSPSLPVMIANVTPTDRPVGASWGDPAVTAAARTVAYLQPYLTLLRLEACEVVLVEEDIILRAPGVRIVWGHAPGQEQEGEAAADVKLQRLLEYHSGHNGLDSLEHDVRLLAYQGHFPLSASENR
jgi:hypothetical protein